MTSFQKLSQTPKVLQRKKKVLQIHGSKLGPNCFFKSEISIYTAQHSLFQLWYKLVNVTRRHAYIISKVHKQIYWLFFQMPAKKRRNRGIIHLICLLSLFLHNCLSSYFFLSFSTACSIVKVENGPFISQTTSKKVEAVYSLAMLRSVTGTNMDANRLIIKVAPGWKQSIFTIHS